MAVQDHTESPRRQWVNNDNSLIKYLLNQRLERDYPEDVNGRQDQRLVDADIHPELDEALTKAFLAWLDGDADAQNEVQYLLELEFQSETPSNIKVDTESLSWLIYVVVKAVAERTQSGSKSRKLTA